MTAIGDAEAGAPDGARPLVTVVLTLHNRGHYVAQTLGSVLAQTYERFEVIVIDDGSVDDGPDVVRGFLGDSRVSLALKAHTGVAGNRNAGAALASPEATHLIFLDDDDAWSEGVLATLVDTLASHPAAVGAFTRAELIDAEGAPVRPGLFRRQMRGRERMADPGGPELGAERGLEHVFLALPVVPMSCLMVRRDAFARTGGFDPSYPVGSDWDFISRLARLGPLRLVDRPLVAYRRHGSNLSNDDALAVRTIRRVWSTTYHSPANTPEQAAALAAIWRAHQQRRSAEKFADGRRLLRRGRPVAGILRIADAVGHRLLLRPLRSWRAPVASAPRSLGETPVTLERAP
ncbi:glycosyltransferase family 2 protein [Agromyces sp. SYSU T00194]|uniref:glycosyltransferase family 2 protein n=1 Tax=Agromyces chitinivorans TaxID=3158560 RepID=UPI0033937D9A